MKTCTKFDFPTHERWTIVADSDKAEKSVCCFFSSDDEIRFGILICSPSIEDVPDLIEHGRQLLKQKKMEKHPEREPLHYYG